MNVLEEMDKYIENVHERLDYLIENSEPHNFQDGLDTAKLIGQLRGANEMREIILKHTQVDSEE